MDTGLLKQARARFGVELHPALCSEALAGIQEILNARLLRYSEDLSGVLLGYTNERILSMKAPVHTYFPFVHVDVAADITFFCPAPGLLLRGKVIQVGPDYLGMHVLGIFNASIARKEIRADFKFKPAAKSCVSKSNPSHVIKEGTEVQFTICSVQHEAEFFTMTGALMAKDTGAVDCLPPSQQQQVSPTLAASQPPSQPRLAQQPAPAKQAESEGTAAVWPSGWKPVNATAKPDSAHKEQQPSGSPEDAELEHLKKKKAKRKHEAIAGGTAETESPAEPVKQKPRHKKQKPAASEAEPAEASVGASDREPSEHQETGKKHKRDSLQAGTTPASKPSPSSSKPLVNVKSPASVSDPVHESDSQPRKKKRKKQPGEAQEPNAAVVGTPSARLPDGRDHARKSDLASQQQKQSAAAADEAPVSKKKKKKRKDADAVAPPTAGIAAATNGQPRSDRKRQASEANTLRGNPASNAKQKRSNAEAVLGSSGANGTAKAKRASKHDAEQHVNGPKEKNHH